MRPQKGRIMKNSRIDYSTLSLRGLRAILPSTNGMETPSETWFRENHCEMLFSERCGEGTVTIFTNGFYTYTEDEGEHLSILRVDGFKRLRYDFADNTQSIVEEKEYLDSPFLVALYINGKNQWDRNTLKRSAYRHEYYLENDSTDWGEEAMIPSAENVFFNRTEKEEKASLLERAMSFLTGRQREFVRLFYFEGLTQAQIAHKWGVRAPTVIDIQKAAIRRLKKSFESVLDFA